MPKVLKSTPRRIAKFPPVPADKTHPVSTGDNWWNLASRYGRSDPWDLIEFNFKTRDPREVNWYLEFFVGCKSPSKDGYNLRFDSADSPGLIYIPPASWTPSEDRALRRMVVEALTGPVTARVNVSHGGHLITGRLLAAVGNRVIERLHDEDPRKDAVYELAWKMAATLGKNVPPGAAEWTALDEAVRKHPTYKKVAGNNAGFDGI